MVIKKKPENEPMVIDLTGPDGNAFVLLGYARWLAQQTGLDADTVVEEMKAGNYEQLVEKFDEYFGHIVTLYR